MSINAATLNLSIEQGATAGWQFSLRHGPTGAPFDLSGCTIRAQVKASVLDAVPLASFQSEIVDVYSGVFVLSFTAAESSKLNHRRCLWDCFIDLADGQAFKIFTGTITVVLKVTS